MLEVKNIHSILRTNDKRAAVVECVEIAETCVAPAIFVQVNKLPAYQCVKTPWTT